MSAPRPRPRKRSRTPKPTASEIAPGVFVGGWKDAESFQGERICVLDEAEDGVPAEAHWPIYDRERREAIVANLDAVAARVASAHEKGVPVLVFCGHGVRRGPLGGAWYLHRREGLTLEEAYDRIRAVRPDIEVPREWIPGWRKLEGSAGGAAAPKGSR